METSKAIKRWLRAWFHKNRAEWKEFCRRYGKELESDPASWAELLKAARDGTVTLLYSSLDVDHNNAVALKAFLEKKLSKNG